MAWSVGKEWAGRQGSRPQKRKALVPLPAGPYEEKPTWAGEKQRVQLGRYWVGSACGTSRWRWAIQASGWMDLMLRSRIWLNGSNWDTPKHTTHQQKLWDWMSGPGQRVGREVSWETPSFKKQAEEKPQKESEKKWAERWAEILRCHGNMASGVKCFKKFPQNVAIWATGDLRRQSPGEQWEPRQTAMRLT